MPFPPKPSRQSQAASLLYWASLWAAEPTTNHKNNDIERAIANATVAIGILKQVASARKTVGLYRAGKSQKATQ